MNWRRQIATVVAEIVALLPLFLVSLPAYAQNDAEAPPSLVEIYWQSSKTISAPGVDNLIILDPDIAKAEIASDFIQIFGVGRGETVALGYRNGAPISIRIRVIQRPAMVLSPGALRRQSEMAQGMFGSTVQIFDSGPTRTVSALNTFSWTQVAGGDGRLDINTQTEENDIAGTHIFNIRHGAISFVNPGIQVQALDYIVSLTDNGPQHYLSPFSVSDSVELRGAALTLKRGDNQYSFFGGTTIPFYYLTLGSTRDIGGFSFMRRQSKELSLYATTTYINAPTDFLGFSGERRNNYMQTAGFVYQPNSKWSFLGTGGASNHGGMGRGEVDYITPQLTFFAAGSVSAPLFPLNQIFSLFSSTRAIRVGLTTRTSDRFTESIYYQHAITQAINTVLHAGSSDYLSPSLNWKLDRKQDLNFSYTFSRNTGGFADQTSIGNRVDTIWRYTFSPRIANSAEVIVGSLQDPLQLSSEDELVFRDGIIFNVKGGSIQLNFQHDRRNPSLEEKLNSELGLLSPALQNLFLQDPVAFVNSGNVPPEIKALLDAQIPISTSVSANGQFRLWNKLSLAPNFTLDRSNSGTAQTWTPFVGYTLIYQPTRTFQLSSGLSDVWVYNNNLNPQRTQILSFGFNKMFSAMPISSVLPAIRGGRLIQGRVFRDNNMNGIFNFGERGLEGIRVELDNGEVAITDEQGRYRFTGVSGGEHRVSLNLKQFPGAVRMTTRNEVGLDLIRQNTAIVDFGLIDFARLMGTVYNDLRFDDKKQMDSTSIGNVHLILEDGLRYKRTVIAEPNGSYELHDIPPGDYKLSIDPDSLPANYVIAKEWYRVHVASVETTVQDVPLRALRSIAGRVFLKIADEANGAGKSEPKLVPMAGIQITAGYGVVKTDENGNFLLRDLPAGHLTVTLVPVMAVPEGMKVPTGNVTMPAEPVQVQGATIVISNPDLVPYLTGKSASQVREEGLRASSTVKKENGTVERNAQSPKSTHAPGPDNKSAGGGNF
ncbi:MAG TPA: SdrD B-like domain-containing protein [Candidatus Angelobacter sp.]|nr:SdrD B-like domain-containing protein [Candidatus Angelobacter sp.]